MNSSDDPFDKKLRKHFQNVFDDFDVQPSTSLKERIWQKMAKPVGTNRPYGLLLVGLLLFVGTGFFYQEFNSRLRSNQTNIYPAKPVSSSQPVESDRSIATRELQPAQHSHRFTEASSSPDKLNSLAHQRKKSKSSLSVNREVEQFISVTSNKLSQLQTDNPKLERNEVKNRRIIRTRQVAPITPEPFGTQPNPLGTVDSLLSISFSHSDAVKKVTTEKAISWQFLHPLSFHTVSVPGDQINRQVGVPIRSAATEQSIKPKTPVRWLVGIAPLSTYQLMTVVARPETHVERVDVPAAFSGPTWSYQLSGGIEWHHFDVYLSFGQLRRWAYYDLAANTFQVKPLGANQYEVIPIDQPVVENISLTMLGTGINKQSRLGGAGSPYFARLGGALSYVPDTRQSLIWANAMIGATLPILKNYQLQVGPTVEYGFSRIWSTERQLIIRPYLVGASITIRPNKP